MKLKNQEDEKPKDQEDDVVFPPVSMYVQIHSSYLIHFTSRRQKRMAKSGSSLMPLVPLRKGWILARMVLRKGDQQQGTRAENGTMRILLFRAFLIAGKHNRRASRRLARKS